MEGNAEPLDASVTVSPPAAPDRRARAGTSRLAVWHERVDALAARAHPLLPSVVSLALPATITTLALVTTAGFASAAGYPWELASHFRPHLAAAAAAMMVMAALLGRPSVALAAAAVTLINAAQVAQALTGRAPAPAAAAPTMTLVWANLAMRPGAFDAAAQLARDVDADVIAFTEVPRAVASGAATALDARCVDMPGPTSRLRVMIATRAACAPRPASDVLADTAWPHALRALEPRLRPVSDNAARVAPAQIVALHPPPPLSPGRRAVRDVIIRDGAEAAAAFDTAVLVGDFNATPWSPVRGALRGRGLRGVNCGAPWTATWFTRAPWGLPIDAAYVRGPIRARCRVGPPIGSDHFPLIIELAVEAEPPSASTNAAAARLAQDAPDAVGASENRVRLRGLDRNLSDPP